jgi:excisionase family DNA binding protein
MTTDESSPSRAEIETRIAALEARMEQLENRVAVYVMKGRDRDGRRQVYSPAEVADILAVTAERVDDMCARAEIPALRLGEHWCIPVRRLEEHLGLS